MSAEKSTTGSESEAVKAVRSLMKLNLQGTGEEESAKVLMPFSNSNGLKSEMVDDDIDDDS